MARQRRSAQRTRITPATTGSPAGIVVPLAGAAVARRAARAAAPAPGRVAATVTDLLDGAADLHAFGAADAALAHADVIDAELTRTAGRTAAASALGPGC